MTTEGEVQENGSKEVIISGTFHNGKHGVLVTLSSSILTCEKVKLLHQKKSNTSKHQREVFLSDIIATTCKEKKSGKGEVIVHHIRHLEKNKLMKPNLLHFSGSLRLCMSLSDEIQRCISELQDRPKRLLFIVNPISGKKTAVKIYKKVLPLFKLCKIETDVLYTERKNHVKELLETYDLDRLDGIVVISGDGTCMEVLNAVVCRAQRQAGIDFNNPEAELKPLTLPIGMIPGGAGNYSAYARYGNTDPISAALHVIKGERSFMPMFGVYHKDGLLSYALVCSCYGINGDLIRKSEANRWMGPSRYIYYGIKSHFVRRLYECDFEYLPTLDDTTQCPGNEDAKINKLADDSGTHGDSTITGWRKMHGHYYGHSAFTSCSEITRGLLPLFPKDTSSFPLITIGLCSTRQHASLSRASLMGTPNILENYDFVNVYHVTAWKIKIIKEAPKRENEMIPYKEKELGLLIDGDFIKAATPEMETRLYTNTIMAFM